MNKTKNIVSAAMFAALCCIVTMIIKIPSPLKGYLNLGDCVVLLAGFLLLPGYGFFAAGLGSALADIFSGYLIYSPATFIIKGLMALNAYYCFRALKNKFGTTIAAIISGVISELIMIGGYYIFEGAMYGFLPSAVNIPANALQGLAGLIIGVIGIKIFEKRIKL